MNASNEQIKAWKVNPFVEFCTLEQRSCCVDSTLASAKFHIDMTLSTKFKRISEKEFFSTLYLHSNEKEAVNNICHKLCCLSKPIDNYYLVNVFYLLWPQPIRQYKNTEIHCVSSKFVHFRSIHYWFIDVAFVIFHFILTLWALQAFHKPMNEWMKNKTNKWMNFTWKTQVSYRHKSFGIDIKFTNTENFNNNKNNSNNQKTKWIISLHSTSSNKSMKCVIQPKGL